MQHAIIVFLLIFFIFCKITGMQVIDSKHVRDLSPDLRTYE